LDLPEFSQEKRINAVPFGFCKFGNSALALSQKQLRIAKLGFPV
jgi:hypothetical protein